MKSQSFRILLADDDEEIRFVVSTHLRYQKHDVEVVDNGKEAIRLFALKPDYFDVLITDHKMPMVTGLELVEYLRKNEFLGKIIVITGTLTSELTTAYRNKHVDNILQKPFMLENLSSALNDILEQWKPVACA